VCSFDLGAAFYVDKQEETKPACSFDLGAAFYVDKQEETKPAGRINL
jgi:hypothetical protein